MRVLISGGDYFRNRRIFWQVLDKLNELGKISLIIHGARSGTQGTDNFARVYALERGIATMSFAADFEHNENTNLAISANRHRMFTEGAPDLVLVFLRRMLSFHRDPAAVRVALARGIDVVTVSALGQMTTRIPGPVEPMKASEREYLLTKAHK